MSLRVCTLPHFLLHVLVQKCPSTDKCGATFSLQIQIRAFGLNLLSLVCLSGP